MQVDAQSVECEVVEFAAHRLDAFFPDQRHQSAAQGEKLRRHHHRLMPWPFQRDSDLGLDGAGARGHAVVPVGQEDGFVDIVGDEQHRDLQPLPHVGEDLLHDDPGLRIERAERFVEQQDLGAGGERANDADALLDHSAGQAVRFLVFLALCGTEKLAGGLTSAGVKEPPTCRQRAWDTLDTTSSRGSEGTDTHPRRSRRYFPRQLSWACPLWN